MSLAVADILDPALMTTAAFEKTKFSDCKGTLGHAWFYTDVDWQSSIGDPYTLRCERCGSLRRESMNALGKVNGRRYIHPPGYKNPPGSRPKKGEFRVLSLVQLINQQREKRKQ